MASDAIPPQRHVAHFPDTTPVTSQWLPGPSCCLRLGHLEATTARIDADVAHLRADVNHLRVDVNQLKVDVTELKIDMATVKERLSHMPTKAQLLLWGLGAAAVIIAAQWRIVGALLEAQNAALAAQLARAMSS